MDEKETASKEVSEAPEPVEAEAETEEATEEEPSSSQIDYESELKVEKERREKAEKAAIEYKQKLKRISERGTEEAEETEPEEKPVSRAELQQLIAEVQDTTRKTLTETNAAALAKTLASNNVEEQAILAKWHNRSFPSDVPLQEQMEEMHAAVNRKKLLSEKSELERALKSKDNVSKDAAPTQKDAPKGDTPKLSAADAQGMKAAGWIWDGTKRDWKKPLGKGRFLRTDSLTSPNRIE